MYGKSFVKQTLAGATFAAALLVPTLVSAQSNARGSGQPAYHLMQLSVDSEAVSIEDFKAQTETINSCGDAREVARALGAEIKRDRFVPSWNLPKSMKAMLEGMETGEASEILTSDGTTLRVIVICNRA